MANNAPSELTAAGFESLYGNRSRPMDSLLKALIWFCAILTVVILVFIIGYILINGLPHVTPEFVMGRYSEYNDSEKGILPMIINTVYVIALTLLISVPAGIGCAIYLTQYSRQGKLVKTIRFATEVLAGIPSIIYALFGYAVFVVMFRLGYSILAGCFTMSICILPTIVRTTEEALLAVPISYKEGAMALGASRLRVILGMVLPCAVPGILTSVILAMGRIVGETAALWFTVGTSGYFMPTNVLGHVTEPGRTLALHLYQSAMLGRDPISVSYATASVLLILIFLLNRLAGFAAKRLKKG